MHQDQDFTEKYRAVQSRDARFDGQFVSAISSTGIYCRPSCPARTPKPENITFYSTSAAAHEDGYRACRRCLPEAAPGSPQWNIRQDLAARAMRLIREGLVHQGGVQALSSRLGYTSRHIHRTVTAEVGAGPLALDRAHRAQTARTLLVTTDVAVSDVAFASGFSSIRQFNETIREIFAMTPREIRAHADAPAASPSRSALVSSGLDRPTGSETSLTLELELPVRHPFDAEGIFSFLAERALAGVEYAHLTPERLIYARTLRLGHGPSALWLTATRKNSRWTVRLRCELVSLADVTAAVAAARRLLDLDADPEAADAALSHDPTLAPLIRRTPGIRIPGTADSGEYLIRAIIGQQISVAAARTQASRLATILGAPYASRFSELTTLFPTAEQIIAGLPEPAGTGEALDPERPLRLPARSIRTVRQAAGALASGELALHQGADPSALSGQLTALPGIGDWTASYLILRTLGHPDTWMTGDVALVAGAKTLGLLETDLLASRAHESLSGIAQRWSPWRSYAAMHLWSAAKTPPKGSSR